MRNLFIVLAKLAGLFQLYFVMLQFLQFAMLMLAINDGQVEWGYGGRTLAGLAFYIAVTATVTWLLLVKTTWLAKVLRIPEDESFGSLDSSLWLSVGVKLIGVYVTVYALPAFVRVIMTSNGPMLPMIPSDSFDITKLAVSAFELLLGLLLMFQSAKVVGWMNKKAMS